MSQWCKEQYKDTILSLGVKETLYSKQSQYQLVEIFDTKDWGRVMMLDGCMMVSERDEMFYHETITHLPMALCQNAKRVLVMGGGDGGTVRELAKYSQIEHIDIAEIDGDVISSAREYLPSTGCGFDDPRVHIHVVDANDFLREISTPYDLIICDGSDPIGFAEILIHTDFYQAILNALTPTGIFITQSGSPLMQRDEFRHTWQNINKVFCHCEYAWSVIPIYPGAFWSFMLASQTPISKKNIESPNNINFWSESMVSAMLSRPKFMQNILKD